MIHAIFFAALPTLQGRSVTAQSHVSTKGRTFEEGTWRVHPLVGGSELLQPFFLRAVRNAVVTFDQGDFQLKAYSVETGKLLWRFGRRGQGPWEISQLNDLQVSGNGDIFLADGANQRVTVLDATGSRRRMVSIRSTIRRVLPMSDDGFLAKGGVKLYWDAYDAGGARLTPPAMPDFLHGVEVLAAEPINQAIDRNRSVIAFRWSDRVIVLDEHGAVNASGRGPEMIAFPATTSYKAKSPTEGSITVSRVMPDATWAAFAVTGQGDEFWVLFVGKTEDAGRILDRFDSRSAAYLGSLRLPQRPIGIAGLGAGRLAVLYDDPEPRVDVLAWIPRREKEAR